jgi:phosphoadenosine phosphosulfate reductase
MSAISPEVHERIASGELDAWPAEDLIKWGLDQFAPRIALSASFGSPEGLVILDLMHRIAPERARVFTIDTGRLPPETHSLMDRARERYGVEIELFMPDAGRVESMVRRHGVNLFYDSLEQRQLCCGVRKVEPLKRALSGLDAWLTGLRPGQGPTRSGVRAVEVDRVNGGQIKINPLARWTREQVDSYVTEHGVPINALHARGYPSVGCAPCSRAVRPGDDERSGRWWWEADDSRECGLHVGYEQDGSGI